MLEDNVYSLGYEQAKSTTRQRCHAAMTRTMYGPHGQQDGVNELLVSSTSARWARTPTTAFPSTTLLRSCGWRSDECEVALELLLQQSRSRCPVNGRLCLSHRLVLHQRIALCMTVSIVASGEQMEQDGLKREWLRAHLDITRPSVQVEMQVFNLPIFRELVHHILLGSLFVHVGDKHNPALDSCTSTRRVLVRREAGRRATLGGSNAWKGLTSGCACLRGMPRLYPIKDLLGGDSTLVPCKTCVSVT